MSTLSKIEDYATYRVEFSQKFPLSKAYMHFEEFSDLWDREFDGEDTYQQTVKKESDQRVFI